MAEHQCMILITKNGKRTLAHSGKRGAMNKIYKHLKSEANPENIDCVERWDIIGGLSGKHDHAKKDRKVIDLEGGITPKVQLERVRDQLVGLNLEMKTLKATEMNAVEKRSAIKDLAAKISPLSKEAERLESQIQRLEEQLA
jgi:hypothetical protein